MIGISENMVVLFEQLIVIVFNLCEFRLVLKVMTNGDLDYCGDFLNLVCFDARNQNMSCLW